MRQRTRIVVAIAFVALVAIPAAASAHIMVVSGSTFSHASHSRNLYMYRGTSSVWSAQDREAQINWDNVMNGSLRFNTVSHENSVIHTVDENYGATGWIGLAPNSGYPNGYHPGHGHVQLNLFYGNGASWQEKRQTACHEIGHYAGLAHSTDATDCMRTPVSGAYIGLGSDHRDQLRSKWNSTGH